MVIGVGILIVLAVVIAVLGLRSATSSWDEPPSNLDRMDGVR